MHWHHQHDVTWDATGSGCCRTTSRRLCGAPFCVTHVLHPTSGRCAASQTCRKCPRSRRFRPKHNPFRRTTLGRTARHPSPASHCLQIRQWRQPVPEWSNCRGSTPRWARTTRCTRQSWRHSERHNREHRSAQCQTHPVNAMVRRQETGAGGTSQGDCGKSQGHFGFCTCRPRTAGSTFGGWGTQVGSNENLREGCPFTIQSRPLHIVPEVEEFQRLQDTIVGLQQELAKLRARQSDPTMIDEDDDDAVVGLLHKKSKVGPSTPLAITSGHAQNPGILVR